MKYISMQADCFNTYNPFYYVGTAASKDQQPTSARKGDEGGAAGTSNGNGATGSNSGGGAAAAGGGNQQQDWSILWSCFENPLTLLSTSESLPKGMQVRCNCAYNFI